jgi:SAM-dependent methyltransferase
MSDRPQNWSEVVEELLRPASDGPADQPPSVGLPALLEALETYQHQRPDLAAVRAYNRQMVDELHGLRPLAGQRLLDLGASYCGFALERALEHGAALYVGVGLEVTGLEARGPTGRGRLLNMNAEALAFEDASFDLALSLSTFEHFRDGARVLRELHRVLRPGGSALLSFEPVWTASYGHHLHHLPQVARLIPPWAHLLWGPEQMRAALAPQWPGDAPSSVDDAVRWTYHGGNINRLPLPALRGQIEQGPLAVEWLVPLRDGTPEARPELAEYLARVLPWSAEDLLTVGLSALLTRR